MDNDQSVRPFGAIYLKTQEDIDKWVPYLLSTGMAWYDNPRWDANEQRLAAAIETGDVNQTLPALIVLFEDYEMTVDFHFDDHIHGSIHDYLKAEYYPNIFLIPTDTETKGILEMACLASL